ncbi:MAG TPA: histidine kinase [Baekduia sp.]|uniref:sensor histidine kinase n=1 Tax=Baekduia sp. TaxID=2600305 RepID=UPI002D7A1B63|nr:histidine kinase [Baekduia sp.]HET6508552.1 histidine kinase [Baekduia sp.]
MAQPGPVGVSQWQRPLLPAALLAGSEGRRTPRDWVVDGLMYALCGTFGLLILLSTVRYRGTTVSVLDAVCGLVAFAALWFRRGRPGLVALVVVSLGGFSALAAGASAAALFNAALRLPLRALAGVGALSAVATATSALAYGNDKGYDWSGLVVGLLITAILLVSGLFTRAQRDLVASLHERAARLEAERRLHEEEARAAERRRIAREMHDVLAHRISLLSLHAGALEFRPDAPPEEIAAAAGVVRGAAHAALQELRDVIGVLREDDLAEAVEPPQPTLCDVPALVEESRAAGARVDLEVDVPDAEALPSAVGRTAYRIVQEGLTNARKHAPGAAVAVGVLRVGGELTVRVVSRPPVAVGAVPPPGAGTGLIGLGERVGLAGGTLAHGLDDEGDFVLSATLPAEGAA